MLHFEDEHRDIKLRGETGIPAGTYKIEYRTEGGFTLSTVKRFQDIQRMLHTLTFLILTSHSLWKHRYIPLVVSWWGHPT